MASAASRAVVAAVVLVVLASAEAPSASAFEPAFAFPGLKDAGKKGNVAPTEAVFVKGCFSYVYGLLHQNGKELYNKPAELPDVVMKICVQEDKKGCHRFAQQLQHIVEAKEKEGPIGHMRHAKARAAQKASPKAEKAQKVDKVEKKAEKAKKQPEKVEKKAEKVEKTTEKAEKAKLVAPTAQKHHKRKPGARVKAEDREDESFLQLDAEVVAQPLTAFAQDFVNFGIEGAAAVAEGREAIQTSDTPPAGLATPAEKIVNAPKPAVTLEEKKQLGLVAQDAQRRPLRYNEWCSNLYTVATATYDPTKAKASPAAPAKASVAPPKASPKPSATNATNATNATVVKAKAIPAPTPAQTTTAAQPKAITKAAQNSTSNTKADKAAKVAKKA